ncbi:outer membrane lipoprotein carrier protein LolA [Deinococcus sp. Marseille-Q6407]|uniref:outer membrane lipoprotein carrier protein LolA n=1 Tax=Deinococcus sp. Marseille-Q6407 TaxID=2969223 RepID=UPI0021BEB4FF|nr:outer membrane lipoprotein carrier protein LolA [Deinococcus sp. Marseille-Q6407]
MKKAVLLSLTAALALLPQASAQTANDVLYKVDQMQKNAHDLSFRLSGRLLMQGANQNMNALVRTIPAREVVRMEFRQPQSLSGDVIVSDRREVRQYWSLSNQITVSPLNRAGQNSGLGLDFTQLGSAANLSSGYNVRLLGTSNAGGGRLFKLQATSKQNPKAGTANVWVTSQGWRPTRVQMFQPDGQLAVDLNVTNFKTNTGVTEAQLRALPRGARVVKQ